MAGNIITLLTDFGMTDYFVPAMKGVILTINSEARIVDLAHEIPPLDIRKGSFVLGASYKDFPAGTIHVAVIDPGVGTERRPIIVETADALFVGPDNGIFSRIYENEDGWKVYRIDESEYQLPKSSSTFNGRDIFAPVAAWLSRGIAPDRIGVEISDPVRLNPLRPGIDLLTGRIVATIINIDRFGNCVTSLTPDDLPVDEVDGQGLLVAGSVIDQFCDCFGAAQYPERPFAYPGSAGYWEIGCWYDSAADRLGIRTGDQVVVDFSRGDQ